MFQAADGSADDSLDLAGLAQGQEYIRHPEQAGGHRELVVHHLGSERGAVSGDPRGVGLAELGHHRRDRLVGVGQQLADRFGQLGRGACPYGLLQLGNQAGD